MFYGMNNMGRVIWHSFAAVTRSDRQESGNILGRDYLSGRFKTILIRFNSESKIQIKIGML